MSEGEGLRRALRAAGLRTTRQREAVYAHLHAARSHPTAEQVFASVRGTIRNISLATVYKALEALVEAGLAQRLADDGGGAVRYDGRAEAHYHLRCRETGELRDLELPYDEGLLGRVAPGLVEELRRQGYEVSGHRLEVLVRAGG